MKGAPRWETSLVSGTKAFMICGVMCSKGQRISYRYTLPCLAWILTACNPVSPQPEEVSDLTPSIRKTINPESERHLLEIDQEEARIGQTLWAAEKRAQELGHHIEDLWDRLRRSDQAIQKLCSWLDCTLVFPTWQPIPSRHSLPILTYRPDGRAITLESPAWRERLKYWADGGWIMDSIELRHMRFDPGSASKKERSHYELRASLVNTTKPDRLLITGSIEITWRASNPTREGVLPIDHIDAGPLEAMRWQEPPPFEEILVESIKPPLNADAIDPLLVADLNRDGTPEIVLANRNLVYRYQMGKFLPQPLCTFSPGLLSTALLADLDGNGGLDLVYHKHEGLYVAAGTPDGIFDQFEVLIRPSDASIHYPMVLSAGDLDADGDLDLFMGQYRIPYEGGSLPTPFHDANDGYPFFLLENQGDFHFADITASSGLDRRRHRRVYSASLVDLDHQPGLDLVVVSDFAGADLYLNLGQNQWRESTDSMLGTTLGFGMAHTFSDFNQDGRLDLLMIGMGSPTVSRLDHLGLYREGMGGDHKLRSEMTFGNRLFLSSEKGGFDQRQERVGMISAGWAWGCTSGDFDLNGEMDLYIANGLESRETVQDYEAEYWLHDAFLADSKNQPDTYLYFKQKFERTRGQGMSYGGYESNRLFLGVADGVEQDAGPLLGVGLQRDSRNVVSADFDRDGRLDLVLTHFEPWPNASQTLRVYLNRIPPQGHWIGFEPAQGPGVPSPIGLQIQIDTGDQSRVESLVTGDSFRSQHPAVIHFGLGAQAHIDRAIVRWPDGASTVMENLSPDRYHKVDYPALDD